MPPRSRSLNRSPTAADRHARLLRRLQDQLIGALEHTVGRGTRVALVDFPNHDNVGDTAIWLGERAALRALGCEVAYVASFSSYRRSAVRRHLGGRGVVLLHGGGNFGDLWPTFHAFRDRVVAENADRTIVQLPQSAHFQDPSRAASVTAAVAAHPDITLMARDRPTEALFLEHFPHARVVMAPDSAFALGALQAPPPSVEVLCLARTDHERAGTSAPVPVPGVRVGDWPSPPRSCRRRYMASRLLGYPLKRDAEPLLSPILERPLASTFQRLAFVRLTAGLDAIASGGVVVTDRLHAHILSLLISRPHVLVDNSYGKLRRFFDEWTRDSELTSWAPSLAEGVSTARDLGV